MGFPGKIPLMHDELFQSRKDEMKKSQICKITNKNENVFIYMHICGAIFVKCMQIETYANV